VSGETEYGTYFEGQSTWKRGQHEQGMTDKEVMGKVKDKRNVEEILDNLNVRVAAEVHPPSYPVGTGGTFCRYKEAGAPS
jgi:L-rhamnose isomerase